MASRFFLQRSARAFTTATVKWNHLKERASAMKLGSRDAAEKLAPSLVFTDMIRSQANKMEKRPNLDYCLLESRFKRADDPDSPKLLLTKTYENMTVEVHYKITEPTAHNADVEEMFRVPYMKVVKETTKVQLKKFKLDRKKIIPMNDYYRDNLFTKVDLEFESETEKEGKTSEVEEEERKSGLEKKQNKLKIAVNFLFVVRYKDGGGLVADCSTENSRLTIYTVSCTDDVDELLSELTGESNVTQDIGPKLATIDKVLGQGIVLYLKTLGLDEKLLLYIECSAAEKEQEFYKDWLKEVKKFMEA